jgi:hypothetical protein
MLRRIHGVDSQKINFGQIRSVLIPEISFEQQTEVERQYLEMAACHDRAMAVKERLLEQTRIDPGQYGQAINAEAEKKPAYRNAMAEAKERLDHLLTQLVMVIEGRQTKLKPFPE